MDPWRIIWRDYAYCSRYGHLQLSELRAMTLREMALYKYELGRIIKAENGPADDEMGG